MLIGTTEVDETDASQVVDAIGRSPNVLGVIAIVLTNDGDLSIGYDAVEGLVPFEALGRAISDHLDATHETTEPGTGVLAPEN